MERDGSFTTVSPHPDSANVARRSSQGRRASAHRTSSRAHPIEGGHPAFLAPARQAGAGVVESKPPIARSFVRSVPPKQAVKCPVRAPQKSDAFSPWSVRYPTSSRPDLRPKRPSHWRSRSREPEPRNSATTWPIAGDMHRSDSPASTTAKDVHRSASEHPTGTHSPASLSTKSRQRPRISATAQFTWLLPRRGALSACVGWLLNLAIRPNGGVPGMRGIAATSASSTEILIHSFAAPVPVRG